MGFGSGGEAEAVSRTGPEDARFEVKFVATALRYHALLHWIRVHPAALRRPFPPRRVNNVYFDSHDLSSFWQTGGAKHHGYRTTRRDLRARRAESRRRVARPVFAHKAWTPSHPRCS